MHPAMVSDVEYVWVNATRVAQIFTVKRLKDSQPAFGYSVTFVCDLGKGGQPPSLPMNGSVGTP